MPVSMWAAWVGALRSLPLGQHDGLVVAISMVAVQFLGTFAPQLLLHLLAPRLQHLRIDRGAKSPKPELIAYAWHNQLVATFVGPLLLWPLATPLLKRTSLFRFSLDPEVPAWHEYLRSQLLLVVCNDVCAYWAHRALHEVPGMYKY